MDKKIIYLEPTVISYLTARTTSDPIKLAQQLASKEWWNNHRHKCDIFISNVVLDEIREGDPAAAQMRMALAQTLSLLQSNAETDRLSAALIALHAIPDNHKEDADHIAIASIYPIEYLVTWNQKHILNVSMRDRILSIISDKGYTPPRLVTPAELLAEMDD